MAELGYAAWLLASRQRRVFREHRDAFELSDTQFVGHYRLTKAAVRWLCDELRPALQRRRQTVNTMSVEQRVLCALRLYAAGGFQGTVASDEHLAVHQTTVSTAVKEVTDAIIATLASQWLRFPQTDEEKSEVKRGFSRRGQISGVIGELANIKFLIVTEPGTEGAKQKDRTMQSQCETTGSPYWSSE